MLQTSIEESLKQEKQLDIVHPVNYSHKVNPDESYCLLKPSRHSLQFKESKQVLQFFLQFVHKRIPLIPIICEGELFIILKLIWFERLEVPRIAFALKIGLVSGHVIFFFSS